ncbi:PREDICTED: factor of DNA methylation 4-like [Camelina sativa]|uniref:Factor of DNA methylation 4-like n=1 Tax=Camelina sativa TaxID=90675 RepID=A0ABM0XFI5_CAMSA|nr:PREDICTED: factor of DNA methylation 4-like [Camelina sativa]
MAGTCTSIRPRLIGSSSIVELSRLINRAGVPFSVRISTRTRGHGGGLTAPTSREEGPSCIFVGPIDSARKETLEALYRQAKDAYYNGKPLIVDDMFDRVELKLRWYGSKSVVKYPRCSLLRQSTYADAELYLIGFLTMSSLSLIKKGIRFRDDKLYGWVAREEDYNRSDIVGKNVKKKRDLKSISQLQEEDERKMVHLVESMSESIKMKKKCKEELEQKVDETTRCLESLELHNVLLNKTYQEGIEKMQTSMQGLYDQILGGHQKSMAELEAKREMLEERAKQIEQRAYINEEEMRRSRLETELNQKAMWEQNEANEEAMKLAKKHQKEKEKLHQRIMEMEAKLNETQELELEIEKLKGTTNVMKHMVGSDGDGDIVENIAKTKIELEARETALHEKMMALTQKERATNDEYQEARKEMIQLWNANEELMKGEKIRVKRMGQLNPEPFLPAVMKKFKVPRSRAEIKAMQLCSVWEANIGDVQWSPFKIEDSDGTAKRVVDKNDEKLRKLKSKYGEEVHNEVVRAKLEIEEHNASGGYVIVELWNYEENRKATMGEVTDVILKIRSSLAAMKNKRKRP